MENNLLYDVFICHASADKDSFVRPLAEKLRSLHVEVWYDEFSLDIGDSIRESIDKGLAKSRYCIVVLSKNFFKKRWPQRELNGLTAREMSSENNVLLPIWHNITFEEILEYSPPLADRKAILTNLGLDYVCKELIRKLRPQESPLIVAQNELIKYGLKPPVVTDEWWLDVIEASKKIPSWGFAPPEDLSWGRWTFPLPNFQEKGEARGIRVAWTAMQLQWEKEAERQRITQITRPEKVLEFIDLQPGLNDMCHNYPLILAAYAPQLTIPGFGGEFEEDFDILMNKQKYIELSLRYENYTDMDAGTVACNFIQGEIGGPDVRYYDIFEYLVWLLSSDSNWLPIDTHDFIVVMFQ